MPAGISMRLHSSGGHAILAAADSELLGSRLSFPPTGASFKIERKFYGEPTGEEDLRKAFSSAGSANLVGKRTLAALGLLGAKSAVILSDAAGRKVPHLQVFVTEAEGDE